MFDHTEGRGEAGLDVKKAGVSAVVDVRPWQHGRCAGLRVSGEWTDGVFTVYGRVGSGTWHSTGETITAADPKTDVIDLTGWSELKIELTTPDTGPGGSVLPEWILKAQA